MSEISVYDRNYQCIHVVMYVSRDRIYATDSLPGTIKSLNQLPRFTCRYIAMIPDLADEL